MSRKKSSGSLAIVVIAVIAILVIKKIWPIIVGLILIWVGYRLFQRKKAPRLDNLKMKERSISETTSLEIKTRLDDSPKIIEVPSVNFWGLGTRSQNKKYSLAWSNGDGTFEGVGKVGQGTYVLLEDKKVILKERFKGSGEGKVANNGSFILRLGDGNYTNGLHDDLGVFDITGKRILNQEFKALIYNTAISDDGKYAICQTANAPSDDGNKLYLFDLEKRTLLWKKAPDSGWAYSYEFDTEQGFIYLVYYKLGKFRYDMQGNFLERDKWIDARIEKGSGIELSWLVTEIFKTINQNSSEREISKILDICDLALKRGFDNRTQEKAMIYKVQGGIYDLKGDFEKAVEKYEQAIALDPKIGVKRRLSALKK